jgi:hypothetical protein
MQINNKKVVAIKFTGSGNFNRDSRVGSDWYHKRNIMADISRERKGEPFGVEQFRKIIKGIGMAAGQPEHYAEDWQRPAKLQELANAGIIEFVFEQEANTQLDEYANKYLSYLQNEADYNWIASLTVMKHLGGGENDRLDEKSHRGWMSWNTVKQLEERGLIETYKMGSNNNAPVIVKALKRAA